MYNNCHEEQSRIGNEGIQHLSKADLKKLVKIDLRQFYITKIAII
jgi:hypothetical protein